MSLNKLKFLYRYTKWAYLNIRYRSKVKDLLIINPVEIKYGQLPESQFPAKTYFSKYQDGDWDLKVLPVESHQLYVSYVQHYQQGVPWNMTPVYKFAEEMIEKGVPYRGEYQNHQALNTRFDKCDRLFESIKEQGYKSNRMLFREGKLDNILDLLDEITVNISRDGSVILNDGWHRFITARILNITEITVRVCAKHKQRKS
jgi:hypothetical protein